MTGKQLKALRKKKNMTLMKFYVDTLGYAYHTIGSSLERFAEIPQDTIDRLKKAGLMKEEK